MKKDKESISDAEGQLQLVKKYITPAQN